MPQSNNNTTSNPFSPFYTPPSPMTDNRLPKVRATVLRGLGRSGASSEINDTAMQQSSSLISFNHRIASLTQSRTPGHLETDYGDMTAEWEPNPLSGPPRPAPGNISSSSLLNSRMT